LTIKITNFHGFPDFGSSGGFVMIKLSSEEDHDFQFARHMRFGLVEAGRQGWRR
jgi:hypothetical protein